MFYIGFTTAPRTFADGRRTAAGDITLGDDSRPFESDVAHWSMADYEREWRDAVLRLAGGSARSMFVTSYRGPDTGGHVVWPMSREGTTVVIRGPITSDSVEAADAADVSSDEWRFPLGQLLAFAVEN